VSVLITVPVFGQHEYTHAVVGDLQREDAEFLIVDNRGDYPKIGNERVTTPGENLGWAGGSEHGFRIAFSEGYSHAMTLNNDTRISKGFVTALLDPRLPADAGIVGPMIDHGFPYAVDDQKPEAANYSPRPQYRAVPAVEGTALMLCRECWQETGGMDLTNFKRYGWGMQDRQCPLRHLALRAGREPGHGAGVAETAWLGRNPCHHAGDRDSA
jgi:GT2 family glycosyltransferase